MHREHGGIASGAYVVVLSSEKAAMSFANSSTVTFELSPSSHCTGIHIESDVVVDRLPFSVEDAQRPETEEEQKQDMNMTTGDAAPSGQEDSQYSRVLLDTRLNNRIIDLRVSRMQMRRHIQISFYITSPLPCIPPDNHQ